MVVEARNVGSARDFVTVYEAALGTQHWESIAPLVHPDCTVTFSEGTYRGIGEVGAAFRKTFDLIKDETYEMRDIHWVMESETTAVLTFQFPLVRGYPGKSSFWLGSRDFCPGERAGRLAADL